MQTADAQAPPVFLPEAPYLGIQPFLYSDHPIFFARAAESRALVRHIVVYRGVFLYGESGAGKSSLINAGLIPAAELEGFRADRIRVQPQLGAELVVERIRITADEHSEFLPSSFAEPLDRKPQVVLPADTFAKRIAGLPEGARPLLVFDQFEELVTQFEEAPTGDALREGRAAQQRVVDMLIHLLGDEALAVKLLFVFREDYLAKVRKLLAARPELMDQSLRLAPPSPDALEEIVRGPFKAFPGRFEPELSPELSARLVDAIRERAGSSEINLSEVQVACRRLWESADPEAEFEAKGVEGLLEDYLSSALDEFGPLRLPAIALLSEMVTASGVRNVVSKDDLIARVHEEERIDPSVLEEALDALEKKTRLVRGEARRNDLYLYEITSEFLVEWIRARKEEFVREREREKLEEEEAERVRERRNRAYRIVALGLVVLVVMLFALTSFALAQRHDAIRLEHVARSQRVADIAVSKLLPVTPLRALLVAALAVHESPSSEAKGAFEDVLRTTHVHSMLRGDDQPDAIAFGGADGTLIATAGHDGRVRLWDAASGRLEASLDANTTDAGAKPLPVTSVGFSPDGKLLAADGPTGRGRIWVVASRTVVTDLKPTDSHVLRSFHFVPYPSVEFSRDGSYLLSVAAQDGFARVWSAQTGQQLMSIRGHHGELVNGAVFSPDGRHVLIGSDDHTAQLWNVVTHKRVGTYPDKNGSIGPVAFTPNGKRVLTSKSDGTIRIWNVASSRNPRTLRPATNTVAQISGFSDAFARFSPDGLYAFTVRPDGKPRLWNLRSGKATRLLQKQRVTNAVFSPDSTLLVTTHGNDGADVWDVHSGAHVASLSGTPARRDSKWITAAVFSSDGRLVAVTNPRGATVFAVRAGGHPIDRVARTASRVDDATFSSNGTAVVSVAGGAATVHRLGAAAVDAPFTGEPGPITTGGFTRDGRFIVTADSDGMRVWPASGGREVTLISNRHDVSFAFGSGRTLVWGGNDGRVGMTGMKGQPGRRLGHLPDSVDGVVSSPDGRYVLAIGTRAWLWRNGRGRPLLVALYPSSGAFSPDGRLLALGTDFGTMVYRLPEAVAPLRLTTRVRALAFSPDGRVLAAVGGSSGGVQFWDVATGKRVGALSPRLRDTVAVAYSRKAIVTGGDDGTIRVWATTGKHPAIATVNGLVGPVGTLSFSPDGKRLFYAGRRGGRIMDTRTWKIVGGLDEPPAPVDHATLSPDSRRLVTFSGGAARLWDVSTGRSVRLLGAGGDVGAVAFDSGSNRLAVATGPIVRVWTRGSRRPVVLEGHTDAVGDASFSPDGRLLGTASEDGTARVWNLGSGKPVVLRGHTQTVNSVRFSADGKRVVTGSDDRTATVWSTRGGVIRVLHGHTQGVTDAVFSPDPDGRLVLTTSRDGTARLWDVDTGSACAVFGGDPNPVRAARFDGSDHVLMLDATGVIRREPIGLCSSVLNDELPTIAEPFYLLLNKSDQRALLQPS